MRVKKILLINDILIEFEHKTIRLEAKKINVLKE